MKDRRRNLFMVAMVFLTMTGMIALDVISKWRSARKFQEQKTTGIKCMDFLKTDLRVAIP